MYAYIYSGETSFETLPSLTIDKKSINFFIKPLMAGSQFQQQIQGPETWQLTFFKQTKFSITLTVRLYEKPLSSDESNCIAKAAWFNNEFQTANNEQFSQAMSQFLRGSGALSLDQLMPTTQARYLVNDRSGLAYFSASADQFRRVVLCQALAVAYSQVMSQCMEQLSTTLKGKKYSEILTLYEQILFFNASDYFSLPVKLERHELFTVWKLVRDHWHLNELNRELTGQLSSVATFLQGYRDRVEMKSRQEERQRQYQREKNQERRDKQATEARGEERERRRKRERDEERIRQQREEEQREAEKTIAEREAKRDRKINYAIGFASLLLTFLSIVSLVELTPEHFSQAYKNWVTPVIENISDTE
ncbi:hypothetical protein ACTXPD_07590 [Vreelandella alkaliphila]|uniref:hypothetical protein n=1 Tax=Vreelandella alkaliphila TaxID=272774 RepID=UPI003FD85754